MNFGLMVIGNDAKATAGLFYLMHQLLAKIDY